MVGRGLLRSKLTSARKRSKSDNILNVKILFAVMDWDKRGV